MATPQVFRLAGRRVTTIYTDTIDLRALGSPKVARASEVEYDNDRGGWTVKFADGSYLCHSQIGTCGSTKPEHARIFANRQEALDAEVIEINRRLRGLGTIPEVIHHAGKDAEVLY